METVLKRNGPACRQTDGKNVGERGMARAEASFRLPFFRLLLRLLIALLAVMPARVFAQASLPDLTEAEKDFILRHPVIRVGIDATFSPFEFLDNQGNYIGIAPDYLALIGARTGLRFEPAKDVPYDEAQQKVLAHELDLLPTLGWTAEREEIFLLSQRYYEYKLVLVTRKGSFIKSVNNILGRRIAVQKDTSNAKFALSFLGATPGFYGSEQEALLAVADGRETAMLGYLPTALYAIRDLGLSNLDYITLDANYNDAFHMGVRDDWPELRSILNKAFTAITSVEKAEIQHRWVRVDDSRTRQLILLLGSIVGVFLLVVLVLQMMVRQRTKDLQKQTVLAMEASRAKSVFLARMSHEIRTPMNAIIGLGEVALREHGTPKALECIMGIRSAGADLITIINDILDFSKIESGNLSIFPAPYETTSFLNDVLTVIHVKLAEKPLELILDISPDLPGHMIGDVGRVKQILLNLLSNAVKYTKKGFVKLSAFGEATDKETILLSFIVEDSGVGIDQANMAKLFGEFTRIDEKSNSGIEGAGLGLSIARSLCRIMGGDITVRSEYGKGVRIHRHADADRGRLEADRGDGRHLGDAREDAADHLHRAGSRSAGGGRFPQQPAGCRRTARALRNAHIHLRQRPRSRGLGAGASLRSRADRSHDAGNGRRGSNARHPEHGRRTRSDDAHCRVDGQRRGRHERNVPGKRLQRLPVQAHRNGQAGRGTQEMDSRLQTAECAGG
jgi:signal transduction histidine kinase